jgi:hypothetical protein
METLSEKVYECTLAVEAHMICDLLARGGVSARVDGEFLAGAGGDLPLGNTVKVRVDPAHAAEAREIIADWESLKPPEPIQPVKRPPWHSGLWFFAGLLVGGTALYLLASTLDEDGNGRFDLVTHYIKGVPQDLEIYDPSGEHLVARQNFTRRWHTSTDFDMDGDGVFERHVELDRFGAPR